MPSVRLAPCGGLDRGAGVDIERISFVDASRWLYELKSDDPPDLVVKPAHQRLAADVDALKAG